LRQAKRTAFFRAVNFLLNAQIPRGALRGGVPRSATADLLRQRDVAERQRADEIRIDYVQHSLSAFIAATRQN
jgi:hypothetical protein